MGESAIGIVHLVPMAGRANEDANRRRNAAQAGGASRPVVGSVPAARARRAGAGSLNILPPPPIFAPA